MKLIYIFFIALLLTACGGGSSGNSSPSLGFTNQEISNSILLSRSILDFEVIDEEPTEFIGTINLFGATDFREISLSSSENFGFTDGDADYSDQPWSILSNGDLQFDYAQIGVCTATKQTDNGIQITVTGGCQIDNTIQLNETLVRPVQFDMADLLGKNISVGYDGTSLFTYSLNQDGTLDVLEDVSSDPDDGFLFMNQGIVSQSIYKNTIRIDYTGAFNSQLTHSLFILAKGSLNSGTLIEMNFIENNVLRAVHVRRTFNNSWGYPIGEYYNNNSFMQF